LYLITFELIFDRFDICIEWDESSDINCVFGLIVSYQVKELETFKEVKLFTVLDLIMATGLAGTSGGPFLRPVYSSCPSLHTSQLLLFTIEREKLKIGLSNINKTARNAKALQEYN
jgi:hypothetical protein